MKSGNLNFLEPLGHSRPLMGLFYLYVLGEYLTKYNKNNVVLHS